MNEQLAQLKEWWDTLQPRERTYLSAGAVAVVFVLLYATVWAPLTGSVENLRSTVAKQREDLAWMEQAAGQIKQLQRSSPQAGRGNSMLATVDQRINAAGLKSALSRMEPEGQDSVKIWLSRGSFDNLITMLGKLEQENGIYVESLSVTTTDDTGRVDARATLSRAGS